jgi:hypothetical protein
MTNTQLFWLGVLLVVIGLTIGGNLGILVMCVLHCIEPQGENDDYTLPSM